MIYIECVKHIFQI